MQREICIRDFAGESTEFINGLDDERIGFRFWKQFTFHFSDCIKLSFFPLLLAHPAQLVPGVINKPHEVGEYSRGQ